MIIAFITMRYREVKGHWPFMKHRKAAHHETDSQDRRSDATDSEPRSKAIATEKAAEVQS